MFLKLEYLESNESKASSILSELIPLTILINGLGFMYLNTNYTIVIGSLLTNPAESERFGLFVCCCEVGKKADFAASFHSAQFAAKCWVICFWICSFYCGVRGAFCEIDLCRLWTPGSHPLDFGLRSEGDSNTILQYFYSICKCFL